MIAGVVFALAASLICGVEERNSGLDRISLNGLWEFRFEDGKPLEDVFLPEFLATDKMIVPGSWDAMTRYYNRRGTGCYRKTFDMPDDVRDAFLVVDGCCLRSRFWLDGREIGFSRLPWSRFELATGPLSAGRQVLVAAVDSTVDPQRVKLFRDTYDFYPFGGFHRGLTLELQRHSFELRRVVVRTRDYKTGSVELEAVFAGDGPETFYADVSFDGGSRRSVEFKNRRVSLTVPDFRLWSHVEPNLHVAKVKVGDRCIETRFGIRQVGTAGGFVTLNGNPIYLKGVNRHEAHYEFGSTTPVQLMYEDICNAKDLGCNLIRGCHYAQSDEFLSLCDELGILVWEESLGWGNGKEDFADAEFCSLQEEETRLMVRNSINHPCVIISAFLNEPESTLPSCRLLVDRLVGAIREEDSGHLVTFAARGSLRDISHVNTDLIVYNSYPCWYSYPLTNGTNAEIHRNIRACHEEIVKRYREDYRDMRPILIGETGVKADYGARDPRGAAQYTEDFQAEYSRAMLEEIFKIEGLAGVAIWQFTDAKTYTRTPGMVNRSYGVNTGGLYDLYRRPKLAVESVRKMFREKPNDPGSK